MDVLQRLDETADEVLRISHRIATMEKLLDAVQSKNDVFTANETSQMRALLKQSKSKREALVAKFRERLDLYENKIQALQKLLHNREETLDHLMQTTDVGAYPDVLRIFADAHTLLESDLESSSRKLLDE